MQMPLGQGHRANCVVVDGYSFAFITQLDCPLKLVDCPRKLVHGYEDRVWFNKSGWLFRFNVGSVATGVEAEQLAANSAGVSPLSELCGRRWL